MIIYLDSWKMNCYNKLMWLFSTSQVNLTLIAVTAVLFLHSTSQKSLDRLTICPPSLQKFRWQSLWALTNVLSWQPNVLPRHLSGSHCQNRRKHGIDSPMLYQPVFLSNPFTAVTQSQHSFVGHYEGLFSVQPAPHVPLQPGQLAAVQNKCESSSSCSRLG